MSLNLTTFFQRTGRLLAVLFISLLLLISLGLLTAGSITAQSPDPPPVKGSDYSPPVGPADPSATTATRLSQIGPTLRAKIEPQLFKKLLTEATPPPFVVYLKQQADLAATSAALSAQGQLDEVGRRRAIVDTLQQTAQSSQVAVLQLLRDSANPGGLTGQSVPTTAIRPLWIVNAVAASGALDTVLALAAREDVEMVRLDKMITLDNPANNKKIALHPQATIPDPQSPISNWGIAQTRIDLVHNALKIDGTGVVVANVDTGVDWQHPALHTQYRGFSGEGKLPQHVTNWYDATGDGAAYPVDGNGHGTHTMGTMVSNSGLGVAPGARWIAVKAFNSAGGAQTSWLHAAYQWLLAPNGDPALAPDVVNNSWSDNNPANLEFAADIQALLNAGIFPVFSAGNKGPNEGSIGSPASLGLAFAVGASTLDEEIAIFSSRGPSPFGPVKPDVAAPGKEINSTFPGGTYTDLDGTSMAAPHVAGLAALLLQASPQLGADLPRLARTITSTAIPLGGSLPNNDFGWGRIDAYNAVMSVISAGTMQGIVTQVGNGLPVSQPKIQITPRSGGPAVTVTGNAAGSYLQGLAPGQYDATASAFGYQPGTIFNITILTGTPRIQNFSLSPTPFGTLKGIVRAQNGNAPLAATVQVNGTPSKISTNPADGSYSLKLPIGTYNLTVSSAGHRIGKASGLTINDGATVTQDFQLAGAPSILLVDSGTWSQDSEIQYYQQALSDAQYLYDLRRINTPFGSASDVPVTSTLTAYDIVVWSSPVDSPGYVGADAALVGYLDEGGKLLLSGQDVAYYDSGGAFGGVITPYLTSRFMVRLAGDDSGSDQVVGTSAGALSGLSMSLTGQNGADNQVSPDVIDLVEPDFADALITYDNDLLAGVQVGDCVPYRAMFLSFGLEGINSRTDRQTVMQKTLDWLMKTPDAHKVEIEAQDSPLIGDFNSVVNHTFRLRNIGRQNDTYALPVTSNWPLNPTPPSTLALASCQSKVITVGVRINTTAWHISDTLSLTVQSQANPAVSATATRLSKSPAPVLLVDDDRFFSFADEFRQALTGSGILYDYFQVPKSWQGPVPPSPSLQMLKMHPITVWYTGYDWFQPLIPEEEERLAAYLESGGRLFFSSQDFIYNLPDNKPDEFARTYLGVQTHREDYQHKSVIGKRDNLVSTQLGPYSLTFPPGYNNNTDALTPTTTAQVVTVDPAGQVSGVMTSGPGSSGKPWRTIFLAYGPELLAENERIKLLQRSVGWLSTLGTSTVTPHTSAALDGEVITYTINLINDGPIDLATTYFTATIPANLTLNTQSAELTPLGNQLAWNGPLARNASKSFFYQATIADPLPLGTVLSQTSQIYNPAQDLRFERLATVYVNFPDLQHSRLSVSPAQDVKAGDSLTYSLVLRNSGLVDDPLITATNKLPHMLLLGDVDAPTQGTLLSNGRDTITWTTPLSVNAVATLTYRAVISYQSSTPIENVVRLDDNLNEPFNVAARAYFEVFLRYFPIIFKN